MTITFSTKYLQDVVRLYDRQFYLTEYPEWWAAQGKLHYSVGDLPLGIQRVTAGRIDWIGSAAIYNGVAEDVPISDFGIELDDYKVRMVISGARWNMSEQNIESLARTNGSDMMPVPDIVQTKMDAMRMSIDQRMNELIMYGSSKHGMEGLFTASDVQSDVITDNPYTMTQIQLYNWFIDMIALYQRETKLTALTTELIVPHMLYVKMAKPFLATEQASGSPYEFLTSRDKGGLVSRISYVQELDSGYLESNGAQASGTNRDLIIMGPLTDSRAYQRRFHPLQRTEVWQSGPMDWQVWSYMATTESQFRQPYKFRYKRIPKYA